MNLQQLSAAQSYTRERLQMDTDDFRGQKRYETALW